MIIILFNYLIHVKKFYDIKIFNKEHKVVDVVVGRTKIISTHHAYFY